MSSKPSWKKATNFAIHMGLLIATAPTLASNALDCVLEKGASVYDSSTSSKPLPQSLEENLQVTCLDKAENGRQKFSFENKTYFVDGSNVRLYDGHLLVSEQKYAARKGAPLWNSPTGDQKIAEFTEEGSLTKEFFYLFVDGRGRFMALNKRAKVFMVQKIGDGLSQQWIGWIDTHSIFKPQIKAANPNEKLIQAAKDFSESKRVHLKNATELLHLVQKNYSPLPISQIGVNPKILIQARKFSLDIARGADASEKTEKSRRLGVITETSCDQKSNCKVKVRNLHLKAQTDPEKIERIQKEEWIPADQVNAISARTFTRKESLGFSVSADFNGLVEIPKGIQIVDLNLKICQGSNCFQRVLIPHLEDFHNLVVWMPQEDYIDPLLQNENNSVLSAIAEFLGVSGSLSKIETAPTAKPKSSETPQETEPSPELKGTPEILPPSNDVPPAPPTDPQTNDTEESDVKEDQKIEESETPEKLEAPKPDESEKDEGEDEVTGVEEVEAVNGNFENVVCLKSANDSLNVRDESFQKVLFSLPNGTAVKIFQDFESEKVTLGKETYEVIHIQEPDGKDGYVASSFVKPASSCESYEDEKPATDNSELKDNETEDTQDAKTGKVVRKSKHLKVGQTLTVCTESGGSLSVYDLEFNKQSQRYSLDSGEKVTITDNTLKEKPTPNGYLYIQVKTESDYDRLVAKDFLTSKKCESAIASGGNISNGYIFPTTTSTGYSYIPSGSRPMTLTSMSRYGGYRGNWGVYGASRSGGRRAHAATDLYQPKGLARPSNTYSKNYYGGPFRAMKDGKVIRGATYFYQGTSYIVVHHTDNIVSRYGEIYPGTLYKSKTVKTGQYLGYIKWVGVGSVPPMLHFENYLPKNNSVKRGILGSGKRIRGRNSQRSTHLFDRTQFMKKLEKATFGR
ncbi:MAG: hypothetical protein CL676_00405 [Bdellovibrionaceae bacterium]|nr:hypothetical protein [Pseudobdellovibrionaceae bacterium]